MWLLLFVNFSFYCRPLFELTSSLAGKGLLLLLLLLLQVVMVEEVVVVMLVAFYQLARRIENWIVSHLRLPGGRDECSLDGTVTCPVVGRRLDVLTCCRGVQIRQARLAASLHSLAEWRGRRKLVGRRGKVVSGLRGVAVA